MPAQLLLLLFTLVLTVQLNSQSIMDSAFIWEHIDGCTDEISEPIYAKVEKDPHITQYPKNQFKEYLEGLILKTDFGVDQNGTLKIKMLFREDGRLCVVSLGTKGLVLDTQQKTQIYTGFNSMDTCRPGRQRDEAVNAQGILYMEIMQGKLTKFRNVNFQFN